MKLRTELAESRSERVIHGSWRRARRSGLLWAAAFCTASALQGPAATQADKGRPERDKGEPGRSIHPRDLVMRLEREAEVKADFLAKFPLYIDWPAETFPKPDSPIVIGIPARMPFTKQGPGPAQGAFPAPDLVNSLERALKDRTANGRPIQVKQLRRPEDARDCHIIYVNLVFPERAKRILHEVPKDQPILTVVDNPYYLEQGGIISFVPEGRRMALALNSEAAKRAGLEVSSKFAAYCKRFDGSRKERDSEK